ncbi:MAG: undecaprenyl-phosphate glucose phosphotransferase [Lentisphaerae bacterium]|nr:undecaprenyl-phosphate glucose phosphotransferase [Lentisphaerota bacterium]
MRQRDTSSAIQSVLAASIDACAVFAGFMLATKARFDTGLIPLRHGRPPHLYEMYAAGAAVAVPLFLFVYQALGLYVRPQTGNFENRIPRIVRGSIIGSVLAVVVAFVLKNEMEFSSMVILLAAPITTALVLLERYVVYRAEWNMARHSPKTSRVIVVGTDPVAVRLSRTIRKEPMLRAEVVGYLRAGVEPAAADIPADRILGTPDDLPRLIGELGVDRVILTGAGLGRKAILDLLLLCERRMVTFNMVPDLFSIMTSSMDVQSLNDIPLLSVGHWPLDHLWNRALKRTEDIAGSIFGLVIGAPAIALAAAAIRATSPGPVFFRQERCGLKGKPFTLYKLRTMRIDAEDGTGPVFTVPGDPRTTKVGAFLRRHNLDELPQLWNVFKGDMSLVGPRPERPHFVERFREDINRYMWRHVSKPGITGWAQVNGLRGSTTSIEERVRYDLYYLENWSLAFDLKILLRTVFARENAY